jgi:hypothetical protein
MRNAAAAIAIDRLLGIGMDTAVAKRVAGGGIDTGVLRAPGVLEDRPEG